MELKEEIETRLKRKNQLLIAKDSIILQELQDVLAVSSPKTIIYWSLRESERIARKLDEQFHDPLFLETAINAWLWAMGKNKMYDVKSLILAVHDYAKKTDDPIVQALCHALGQGCSTVHTIKHATGLPMYEMTAMVKERGIEDLSYLLEMKEYYIQQLLDAGDCVSYVKMSWAKFIEKHEKAFHEEKKSHNFEAVSNK